MFDQKTEGERLIFVGGAPRSGSTLLQCTLVSHPDICGGPEFDRVPNIMRLRNALCYSVDIGRIDVFCSRIDINREVGTFIENLLLPFAERKHCKMMSEKTPDNIFVFSELMETFPKGKFIFCVRDPRAIVASMLEVGSRAKEKNMDCPPFTWNLTNAIEKIKSSHKAGFEAVENKSNALIVCYENLVNTPVDETKRICEFLDVSWSQEMVSPGEKIFDINKTCKSNIWGGKSMYRHNPDPSRAGRWREQLNAKQKYIIAAEFQTDNQLASLGYSISEGDSPFLLKTIWKVRLILSRLLSASMKNLKLLIKKIVRRVPLLRKVARNLLGQ